MKRKNEWSQTFVTIIIAAAVVSTVFYFGEISGAAVQSCEDSDSNLISSTEQYYVKGYVLGFTKDSPQAGVYEDYCEETEVNEHFCYEGYVFSAAYECAAGCKDGACIEEWEDRSKS